MPENTLGYAYFKFLDENVSKDIFKFLTLYQ